MVIDTHSPLSPLPIAVVGLRFGVHAMRWIRERYRTSAVRVALVCDRDAALAEQVGKEMGVPWTTSFDEVLHGECPAVALFTPPAKRAELLRELLHAGKDVMTTKPFELDSVAAQAVLQEARSLGRVIHINSPVPGMAPDLRCIRTWQEQFRLGRPVALRADAWGSYQESADGTWYDDPARCPAAPIFRIGIYLINDAITLLGPVEHVHVITSRFRTGRPTPDQAILSMRHKSGALSAITASFCVGDGASYRNALTVNHEHGTVYRNIGSFPGDTGADLKLVCQGEQRHRPTAQAHFAPVWSGEYDWDSFAEAVRERKPLSDQDVMVICEAIRVVEAMAESERTGMPVTLPNA
jgi:predicted dehydrogenase